MLNNPVLCRLIAWALVAVGGYLALFNTFISAVVIGERSGLDMFVGLAIAGGLTAVELWFASWARNISHWKPLIAAYRSSPQKTLLKLGGCAVGLLLIYHFDVESTRLSIQASALDGYFFLWGLSWLIFGPEIAISLSDWLQGVAKKAEAKQMKNNNARDADRQFLRSQRQVMMEMAKQAGRDSGIQKVSARFGPKAAGEGRIDT